MRRCTISAQGPAGAHRDRLGILPAGERVALSGYSLTGRFFFKLIDAYPPACGIVWPIQKIVALS
jgi:hypothetical protein